MTEVAKRMEKITYAIRDVVEVAQRMQNIKHPTRDVVPAGQKVAQEPGKEMLWLNIGDPNAFDFDTPKYVKKALHAALDNRFSGYADSSGYGKLREAVAADNEAKGIKSGYENVLITAGTSEAANMLYGAVLNPGDEVLVPSPCYPQYENLAYFYGARPVFYDLSEEEGFQPDFDSLHKGVSEKTKAVISINPNNPTGAVMEEKAVRKFVEFAGEHKLVLVSDEIYDEMVFEKKVTSAAALSSDVQTVTLNGLSKNFLAPGWRTGWATFSNFGDNRLRDSVAQLCRLRLSAPYPAQVAAVEALSNQTEKAEATREMVGKLRPRRDLAFKRLNEIPGISCAKPEGAFYAFPQVHDERGVWKDDKQFVYQLLEEERVLTVFGSGFGQKAGTKHFRLVFLPPEKILEDAFDRIEAFAKKMGV